MSAGIRHLTMKNPLTKPMAAPVEQRDDDGGRHADVRAGPQEHERTETEHRPHGDVDFARS